MGRVMPVVLAGIQESNGVYEVEDGQSDYWVPLIRCGSSDKDYVIRRSIRYGANLDGDV
jgi:hypothetical protein